MISEAIIGAILVCSPTKVINNIEVSDSLVKISDVNALIVAKKRCGILYNKQSTCVKKFYIKLDDWGNRMYSVVCGERDLRKEPMWMYMYKRQL